MIGYGLSIGQVEQQLANDNINAGGGFVESGMQQLNVRAVGLYRNVSDIEDTVLKTQSGTALRVKDIADVAQGETIADSAVEGAVLRLRPIMMTMLVACFGLVPAALSHAIGSDSQRPFAIVIVGGLVAALLMSLILLPNLYVWIAREGDKLPVAEVVHD